MATIFTGDCQTDGVITITGFICLINEILVQIPKVVAFAAVCMIIYSGIRLINAGSNPKEYSAAWATLSYAVIGLIMLAVVWIILVFIEQFTGAPVTKFGFNI